MRRILTVFIILLSAFTGLWTFKSRTPEKRPDSYAGAIMDGNYWWNAVSLAQTSTDWQLDPEIPKNYIPMPGKENLFMVVDEDGYIIGYRKRTRQEDGSWLWEDVNPDIPENYEPVPGLKDVYKVTYDDGTVKYFKYIRNKDDTYAFVEVDARGNQIGEEAPSGSVVPENYVRVNRNQYAVKNQNGVTIGYKERREDATTGDMVWVNIEEPTLDTPELQNFEFDLTKDVTGKGDTTGGTRPIGGYTISDPYTVGAIPTLMPGGNITGNTGYQGQQQQQTFVFNQPVVQQVETYYITPPPGMTGDGQNGSQQQYPQITPAPTQYIDWSQFTQQGQTQNLEDFLVSQDGGGYYTETETLNETRQEGQYQVVYQTIVTRKYDANGNLLATNKSSPKEVSRKQTQSSDVGAIASTLDAEQARVVTLLGSAGAQYNASVPNKMHELLNDERMRSGMGTVYFSGSSKAYKIALCRAAMMALYGTSSNNLPQYGNLAAMCAMYGVSSSSPSENMLITGATSAEAIHSLLMNSDSAKASMLNSGYTEVAIAIVQKDGKYYIDEIFLK